MSTTMISLPARTGLVSRWSKALAGHLLSWVLSFAVWVATVCLLSVGVGTLIIWVGVPVIALTLLLAHGYAEAKKRLATWQGEPLWEDLPKVQATTATRRRGPFAAVGAQFRNGQRWRELAYALPGAILDWLLASIPLYLLVLGIGEMLAPFNPFESGLFESRVLSPASHWLLAWGDSALGFVTFVLAIPLVWVCARAQTALMRLFLAPSRHAMAARLGEIERSKRAAVEAETASFNRIERDLHDGPQQSLLRSGLDLAAVERRLASGDVDGARTLVAEVRTRNDQTLNDIRTLSRGFAPPVLADKGLREAVASLAATSPIPASVNTELAGVRPPEAIERAIYFAVSESLANAAKHSHASRVAIDVRQSPAGVSAVIADNGTGGAIQVPGHGLAGLADRLASVGGTLTVTSEPGQGTVVRVDVTLR